jgi:hypothetical protein
MAKNGATILSAGATMLTTNTIPQKSNVNRLARFSYPHQLPISYLCLLIDYHDDIMNIIT